MEERINNFQTVIKLEFYYLTVCRKKVKQTLNKNWLNNEDKQMGLQCF